MKSRTDVSARPGYPSSPDVDLVVTTSDGEEVMIGTGPGYMETQGFSLQVGETVQVTGYWQAADKGIGDHPPGRQPDHHPARRGRTPGVGWSRQAATERQEATDQGESVQGRGRGQGRGQGN